MAFHYDVGIKGHNHKKVSFLHFKRKEVLLERRLQAFGICINVMLISRLFEGQGALKSMIISHKKCILRTSNPY